MDRNIITTGEQFDASDFDQTNKNAYIAIAKLAYAVLGTNTLLNGFTCTQNVVPNLNVFVGPGEIYQMAEIDSTPYGDLPIDSHIILKTGINLDPLPTNPFTFTAPTTPGQSVDYLIEFALQETDIDPENRQFYNAAPQVVDTIRQDSVFVKALAGTPATTGTQVPPAVETGFVGGFVVTIAYGQTTITNSNISVYSGAPFITETLTQKISQATADLRYAQKTQIQTNAFNFGVDTGTTNALAVTLTPVLTSYSQGMGIFLVYAANTTTGACTINFNSLGAKNIYLQSGLPAGGGDIVANNLYMFSYDGTNMILLNPSSSLFPPGTMLDYAGASVPAGFLLCDGSALSRTTYAALFSAIGTTWGVGDGSTTFNLPDARRRTSIGSGGTGTGTIGNAVGDTGGEENHTLTVGEIPSHTHQYSSREGTAASGVFGGDFPITVQTQTTDGGTGGNGSHNTMQPSMVVTKIIKY